MPPNSADDSLNWEKVARFIAEQSRPYRDELRQHRTEFKEHVKEDDRRSDLMIEALHRVSTSVEVQTAVSTAFVKRMEDYMGSRDQRAKNSWEKASTIALYAGVVVALLMPVVILVFHK